MKVKNVKLKKIEKLLSEVDDNLYIVNITFDDNNNPVLNLYKPYDDEAERQAEYNAALADLMQWIKDMEQNF